MIFTPKVNLSGASATLAIVLGTIVLPNVAVADHLSTPQPLAQASRPTAPPSSAPQAPALPDLQAKLNLSGKQKEQIQSIQNKSSRQVLEVLTSDQRAQLQQSYTNRSSQPPKPGMPSLNLTQAQKTKIAAIQQSAMEQIQAVYTPEQRRILQENLEILKKQKMR